MGRTHIGVVCGELSAVAGIPSLQQGKCVRRKERQKKCDEITSIPIPCPPAWLMRGHIQKFRSEI